SGIRDEGNKQRRAPQHNRSESHDAKHTTSGQPTNRRPAYQLGAQSRVKIDGAARQAASVTTTALRADERSLRALLHRVRPGAGALIAPGFRHVAVAARLALAVVETAALGLAFILDLDCATHHEEDRGGGGEINVVAHEKNSV